jgi:muramidase (phage lysozyme)
LIAKEDETMAKVTRSVNYMNEPNVKAFLKLLRYCEFGRVSNRDYYGLYGGKETFSDESKHPHKAVYAWGTTSTAAGAYQILADTWDEAKVKGIVTDFTPHSQDRVAIWLIQRKNATTHIMNGDLAKAISHLKGIWPSLPGGTQQSKKVPSITVAKKIFNQFLEERD